MNRQPLPLTMADVLAIEPGDHPSPVPVYRHVDGKAVPMTATEVRNMYLTWLLNAEAQQSASSQAGARRSAGVRNG